LWFTYDRPRGRKPARARKKATEETDACIFARERLGFTPDQKQAELLASNAKRVIVNCSRQWGKSTVAAAKAVHRGYFAPGSLVLVASPSERQSAEFLRKASGLLNRLDIRPRGDGDNAISLLLPNGSRIVGLPGTEATVRGFSAVSLMLIDEASRVPDQMYQSLRPMLAVGNGDLWMMSTPWGKRGFFYEAWMESERDPAQWMRMSVPATECGRISAQFLERERTTMEGSWFAQEYLCEFTDNDRDVFARDLVENALDDTISELRL
jgi:hypothetical protein